MQTTQLALLLLRYTAGRRNGCALKIANVSPKYITTCLPKVSGHSRSLLLIECGTLRDTGEELQHGASANPEGNRGAGVRTPRKPSWEESLRGRRSAEKQSWLGERNRLHSPKPARPPRPSRPRSSASRRRKCCVALPGVVWSPPPRVCGLRAAAAAAAAAALGLGARSDVTAMAGIKALISLSFGGAIGLMFLMLGCALPIYNQYWPLFVLFFYILSPIPYCIARRLVDDTDAMSNACKELAIFLTTGIVVSAFGLPVVFARAHLIEWGACALVLTGNTVIFATILGFFLVFGSNDDFSWQQW